MNGLEELWDYTPWELIKVACQMILYGIWQRFKHPKLFLRLIGIGRLKPKEIEEMKREAISRAKLRVAELYGGSPDDYIVK
jgi:hypothetical protein